MELFCFLIKSIGESGNVDDFFIALKVGDSKGGEKGNVRKCAMGVSICGWAKSCQSLVL